MIISEKNDTIATIQKSLYSVHVYIAEKWKAMIQAVTFMAGRKYASDYRLESHVSPEGKVESIPVYQGKLFTFVEPPERIARLRKTLAVLVSLVALLLIPMLLDNTRLGRTIYIVLPAVFSFLPVYLLMASIRRLKRGEDPFTREHRDKTDKRICSGSVMLTVCLAISSIGCIIHFILNGIAANEILCTVSLFAALAVSILILRWRNVVRTKEVPTGN